MGKLTKVPYQRTKAVCATSELHHDSDNGVRVPLRHQSKIKRTTIAELHQRVGRSRFQGQICINCIRSVEGESFKQNDYVPIAVLEETTATYDVQPEMDISHSDLACPMDLHSGPVHYDNVDQKTLHAGPIYVGNIYQGPDHSQPMHTDPVNFEPGETDHLSLGPAPLSPVDSGLAPTDHLSLGPAPSRPVLIGLPLVDSLGSGPVNTGLVHTNHIPLGPPTSAGPVNAGFVHNDHVPLEPPPTDPVNTGFVYTDHVPLEPPTSTGPVNTGLLHTDHVPLGPPSTSIVNTGFVHTDSIQTEHQGSVHAQPVHTEQVIVLSLGNLRRDLASLSIEMRALIAYELAAIERVNIRTDVIALTKGDFRNIDSLNDMCKADYLDSRNRVLTHFLTGLWDDGDTEKRKPHPESADLPVALHKQSDIYKLAKAIESCMGLTTPIAVLPFHFREIVLIYSHTRSRSALSLLSATAPCGGYQTIRNWLEKLAKNASSMKLPTSKGDTVCVFDNNQVLKRRWNISVDNRAMCSVITMVVFFDIDSEGTLQFQEKFKPSNWMWTNLDSVKLTALREGPENMLHQDNRYRKHFHPWLSGIIQQVASEQSILAGECTDHVDQQVAEKAHAEKYRTCSSCGDKDVPKARRKCPTCDARIRSGETKNADDKSRENEPTRSAPKGEVRVLIDKKNSSTYSFKYERSAQKATEYDHLPQHHPKQAPEINIGEPIFVNPCSYEAVAGVFRQIGKQAGIKRYGGEREWISIVCDGLPFVMGYQLIERTFVCNTCGISVSGLDERRSHRSKHPNTCTFSLEFDWILLQPGPGHIEMNMLKTFVKFAWPVFWEGMVEIFNFKSEVAKRSAHNVNDHHKGMALAKIARESLAKELVLPYVRHELMKEKSELSVAGYLKFAMETVESDNYALMFDLTFCILDAIFLYRAGLRCGDTEMMDAGRAIFARMWSSRTHPLYRQLAIYDTITAACMPPEVQEFIQKTKSMNLSGIDYTGEGLDFKLEEINKRVQHWIPAIPTDKAWKNACANERKLSKLRDSTMSEIDLKDPKERQSRSSPNIDSQVLSLRTALRKRGFLADHDKERPLTSFGDEPLDEDLANFARKAAEKEAIFLENFLQHHENGGFKKKKSVPFKEAPIFVTPQERSEYNNIRNKSIKDCVQLIHDKIAGVEDEDLRKNFSLAFEMDILSKGKKPDYILFYELIEEYQNNISRSIDPAVG